MDGFDSDHFSTDHVGPDHVGPDHVGPDHVGPDHVGPDHVDSDGLGVDERGAGFDVDEFLARPLTARVATAGPTVRPTWYLWEGGAFWILTSPGTRLLAHVRRDPAVALVVDVCDVA